MPVSPGDWRVRIGTFLRRQKKEYDYNYFLRKLFNLIKASAKAQSPKVNNNNDCNISPFTGSSSDASSSDGNKAHQNGSSCNYNGSQFDQNSRTGPSYDDDAVYMKSPCDVDFPACDTVTKSRSSQCHYVKSPCGINAVSYYDGSTTAYPESGNTCSDDDPKDNDCPDMTNMLLLRSGDVELNPGPNDTPGNLTELELYLFADGMDPSDFRKVGLALGFSEAQLSRFEKDETSSMQTTYQMLYAWRKTVRDSEARDILVDKLEKIRLLKLAESLRKGQIGEHIPSLTEAEIERVAKDVKRYLSFELCQIQADPMNSELLLPFERIFTNLTLMEEDKGTKRKIPLLYNALLKTKVNGFYPKRLLVEGEGGVGKTTLCAKIAWDWIHGKGYKDFKLVLVILLRKAKDKTVGEIVKSYLSDDNPVTAKQLDKYVLTHPDDVFLVLDGLDEFAVDLSSIQQIVDITLNRLFKSGTVLITSRQWRSDEIRKNADLRKVFAFIVVEGFSAGNLASYIKKFFHPDTASSEELNRYISGNDVIRENMAPYPIYTAMLCIMWKEFDGERRQAMCKLQTFSQLFDEMINFLVDHYLSKHDSSSADTSLSERRLDVLHHLTVIGEIAFQGLRKRQLVFPEEEWQNCRESVDMGCKVGVLTREKRIPSRRERRTNFRSAVSVVQFPHKLFQEYLSGMYLSSLYSSNRHEYDSLLAEIVGRKGEYHYLLYFTSAQQKEVGLDVVSRLMTPRTRADASNPYDLCDPYAFIVDVAYESQEQEVAKAVADHLSTKSGRTLEITQTMQAHTVSAHIFVGDHRAVDNLVIEKSCGQTASEDLAEFMCTSPSLRSVTIRTNMHDVFYAVLANKAVHSKIETLHMETVNLNERPSASRDLAKFLCKMSHLKKLTLGYDVLLHDAFYSTSSSMACSAKIETLFIFPADLRERPSASRDLAQFICKMPHLMSLTLCGQYHDDFYSTSSSMASSAKIETLDIAPGYLSKRPSASRDLAQFICKMPHLMSLKLDDQYHDDFYSTLSSMASSAKIENLDIWHGDLSERPSASRDLAQFICRMPHLVSLTLHGHYHDDFFSTSSSMASSAKIENLDIWHGDLSERPSASRDLAEFICKMPHLMSLRLRDQYHDDFYSTSSSMASSAKADDQSGNTSPTLTELTISDHTLQGWQDCGSMFDSVKRFTLQVWDVINADVIQRIHLPGATEVTIQRDEESYRRDDFMHEPTSLSNVLINAFPQLVKVTFSDHFIGNHRIESVLQAFRSTHKPKYLTTIRFIRCKTDESVDDLIREFNEDQTMKVEIEHGEPRETL